jgi:hypothetical protein
MKSLVPVLAQRMLTKVLASHPTDLKRLLYVVTLICAFADKHCAATKALCEALFEDYKTDLQYIRLLAYRIDEQGWEVEHLKTVMNNEDVDVEPLFTCMMGLAHAGLYSDVPLDWWEDVGEYFESLVSMTPGHRDYALLVLAMEALGNLCAFSPEHLQVLAETDSLVVGLEALKAEGENPDVPESVRLLRRASEVLFSLAAAEMVSDEEEDEDEPDFKRPRLEHEEPARFELMVDQNGRAMYFFNAATGESFFPSSEE